MKSFVCLKKLWERWSERGFKFCKWKANDQSLSHSIAMKEGAIKTESKIQEPVIEI